MSRLSDDFLKFLLENHKLTGKNTFEFIDYQNFDGYEEAITDLWNRGIVERIPDILGTIKVNVPEKNN